MKYVFKFFILIFLIIFNNVLYSNDKKLNIAVASNFSHTLEILSKNFKDIYKCNLYISSDSTVNLFLKIINGAPFDLFFSADSKHINLLKNDNRKTYIYAYGKIILWNKNYLKKNSLKYNFNLNNFFISNAKISPYGKAGFSVIENLNIKIFNFCYSLNINQVFNYLNILNDGIGIVAFSQIIQNNINKKDFWMIPKYFYKKIRQKMILLNEKNSISLEFFNYIKKEENQLIIKKNGYKIRKND